MRSIGIDIGRTSIKVADVTFTSQGFLLQDFAEIHLTPDPGVDQRIEIVDALRKISAHYEDGNVRYVMSIPEEQVSVRLLQFPFRERHNILRSLPAQLEDDIPFDQDDAIFDAKALRYNGNAAEVLAVACPNKYVQELIQLAEEGGIDPDIITVDTLASSNIFETWSTPPRDILNPKTQKERSFASDIQSDGTQPSIEAPPPCQVVINIGHQRTLLNVYYRGTLLTTRTLSLGGADIVEALRRSYNLPYGEALKGLQEKGFILTNTEGATQDQIDFSTVIASALKPITDNLKLTLLEIRSHFEVEFDQIHLSGGVSRLINVTAFFTQELELPCHLLALSERIPKSMVSASSSLEFTGMLAVGIAIEGLKRPRNPALNLRKQEFGKQSQSFINFFVRWNRTLKYAAAVLALFYVYAFVRSSLSDNLELAARVKFQDTAKDAFAMKGKSASESKMRQFIKEKRNEIKVKKDIASLQDINSALDIVAMLSDRFPGKSQVTVDIRRLLIKNENLTIEGEVPQQSQLTLIRNMLGTQAVDKHVREMTPSIKPSQGKLAFAFTLQVSRR